MGTHGRVIAHRCFCLPSYLINDAIQGRVMTLNVSSENSTFPSYPTRKIEREGERARERESKSSRQRESETAKERESETAKEREREK